MRGRATGPGSGQDERSGLEWLLRGAAALAFLGFAVAFLRGVFGQPPTHPLASRVGAIAGALVCVGVFVPWARLPLLRGHLHALPGYLGVVVRLLTAVTLGALPSLLLAGAWDLALGAAVVAVLCLGLLLAWTPIVWGWYGFVAAGLVLALSGIWTSLHAGTMSFTDGIRLLIRVPLFLLWGAVLGELARWHRSQRALEREQAAARPPAPVVQNDAPAAPDTKSSDGEPAEEPPSDDAQDETAG